MTDTAVKQPILYSFRRCPYAMRARLALQIFGQSCRLREIILRDKPKQMLDISPKGTVPVLLLPDGTVIDESLDIMLWALGQNDPQNWLGEEKKVGTKTELLIEQNDTVFKFHLDRYKYPDRYTGASKEDHFLQAMPILEDLDKRLSQNGCLVGKRMGLADFALFPFIRQFANTDRVLFDAAALPHLQKWLEAHLQSELFLLIMKKYKPWKETGEEVSFPLKP